MLTVQNYNLTAGRNVAFKARHNDENNQSIFQSPKPFQTHAGLKTGAVGAGFLTTICLGLNAIGKGITNMSKSAMDEAGEALDKASRKNLDDIVKNMKALNKNIWVTLPIEILACLGCGALVDKKINDKHAKMADKLETEGKKAVLEQEDRAELTKNNNVFYKSNVGKTFGVALGAVVLPAVSLISDVITKTPIRAKSIVNAAIIGAIDGLILGSITDKVSNKGAAKFADKQNSEV